MNLHIYAPKGSYQAQVRRFGHRRWESVGKPQTLAKAAKIAAFELTNQSYKRARVLFCADWHEPTIVMELNK